MRPRRFRHPGRKRLLAGLVAAGLLDPSAALVGSTRPRVLDGGDHTGRSPVEHGSGLGTVRRPVERPFAWLKDFRYPRRTTSRRPFRTDA
ncbi:hypothetical protein ACGFMK_34490 [Amycolatopsis sp. NPDC049252]|uniref:hypothetical protein n=1 Tax=Amycolatopsis sp. NPDC049252 TaxID=3363933 RepID=UPI0037170106